MIDYLVVMKKTVNLTAAGKADLEKELADLIAQRPAIAERIATARAFGDLSENQEYTDARAEQKNVENSILQDVFDFDNAVFDVFLLGSGVSVFLVF